MTFGYGDIDQYEPDDPDLDALLTEAESVDDLPDEHQVDVGPPLTPSQICQAHLLAEIGDSAWIWSDGSRTELRRCPRALERVARSRVRAIRREETDA